MSGQNVILPRWAKLIPPQREIAKSQSQDKPDEDEVEEEETYVRKRFFHRLSQQMHQAIGDVFDESLASRVSTLEDFLDAATPTPEEQPSRKRRRVASPSKTSESASLFDQQQATNSKDDPLLLPVITVQGPSFGVDRRALMDCLAKNLQKSRPRSAVVQVQHSLQRKGIYELVRQCHVLSPVLSSAQLHRSIAKRRKKKACSFSDMLLLWAQHVSDLDEIVVFLNADGSFYSAELQDFLHILATRRAERGIPVSVVLLGPSEGRRHMELKSSIQGFAGFTVRSLTLPSSYHLLHRFCKRLWIQMKFPILIHSHVLNDIERSFRYQNQSCQMMLQKLEQAMAHKLVQQGSFLAVAHHPAVMSEVWQRVAWFFAAPEGRQFLLGCKLVTSTQMLTALEAIHSADHGAHLCLQLMDSVHRNKEGNILLFRPSFSRLLRKRTRRDLLDILFKLRERRGGEKGSQLAAATCDKVLRKYVSFESACRLAGNLVAQQSAEKIGYINDLIVLVANCRDGDDLSEIGVLNDKVLDCWANTGTAESVLSHIAMSNTQHLALSPMRTVDSDSEASEWAAMADSMACEPRRKIVTALLQAPAVWDWRPGVMAVKGEDRNLLLLTHVAGIMYRLIHERVAVAQEDWFEEFWQDAIAGAGADSREESFCMFSLGLRYLKQCGLIVEKLRMGNRNEIIYERAKLVWCAIY